MMSFFESLRPCWAEIDLKIFKENIRSLKRHLKEKTDIIAVVKADAYGHGSVAMARAAVEAGCKILAVAYLEEALELRAANINAPILVIGYTRPSASALAVKFGITLTVFRKELIMALETAAKATGQKARVHLKIETGMSRIGVNPGKDLEDLLNVLESAGSVEVEGMFTHLAAADTDSDFTRRQIDLFRKAIDQANARGIRPSICHAANSAAIETYPDSYFDAVRPGIMIYGYSPNPRAPVVEVAPVMSWKARAVHAKTLPVGATVGYGRTYAAMGESRIITIPLGYADGYSRVLSDRAYVLVKGQKAKIAGRICMDQMMIDVTNLGAIDVGEEVVLMGRQGDQSITADDMADWLGTISYEVLTSVSRRVLRVYLDDEGAFASIRGTSRKIPVDLWA